MRRGDVYWADVPPPFGRRPVVVLTRSAAIPILSSLIAVPISSTIRGIATEVPLGKTEGLRRHCVATCDALVTVLKSRFDAEPVGRLGFDKLVLLDQVLRYTLDIWY